MNTTKTAQFTPRPWHLEYDVDGIPLTIIGSDNSAVGTVETWNDHADGNRNLIAAAPAMYEALRMLIALDPRCHRGVAHCGECGACLGQAALAQAEGRHHE